MSDTSNWFVGFVHNCTRPLETAKRASWNDDREDYEDESFEEDEDFDSDSDRGGWMPVRDSDSDIPPEVVARAAAIVVPPTKLPVGEPLVAPKRTLTPSHRPVSCWEEPVNGLPPVMVKILASMMTHNAASRSTCTCHVCVVRRAKWGKS